MHHKDLHRPAIAWDSIPLTRFGLELYALRTWVITGSDKDWVLINDRSLSETKHNNIYMRSSHISIACMNNIKPKHRTQYRGWPLDSPHKGPVTWRKWLTLPLPVRNPKLVITIPADALVPIGARSPADTITAAWNQTLKWPRLCIQNAWRNFEKSCGNLVTEVTHNHYSDVIIGAMASQITSLTIVYSTVYSGTDDRKHQSSASLAFVRRIHRWPVNSPHKGPVTRKMFPFDDVILLCELDQHWFTQFLPGPILIYGQLDP